MNTPKFSIFRADGSKVPTLKKSFLVKEHISYADWLTKKLILEDGTEWNLIFEKEAYTAFCKNSEVFCIVSYQAHTHGNYAVARLVVEKSVRDVTSKDTGWLNQATSLA